MRDFISLSPTPVCEDCAQVGSADYHERARKECSAFVAQLRRQLGPEPRGARLDVKAFPHDFGTYYMVVCYFDTDLPASEDYAFKLDAEAPEEWDTEARQALGLAAKE
jgi:hypothetical protein